MDSELNELAFAHGRVDLARGEVIYRDGRCCSLSGRELGCLKYMAARPGALVSRDELLAGVWRIDPSRVLTRTVDMHISNLRRKLLDDPKNPTLLKTVNRHGYVLALPSDGRKRGHFPIAGAPRSRPVKQNIGAAAPLVQSPTIGE